MVTETGFTFTNTTTTSPDPEIIALHELYQALSWDRANKARVRESANLSREVSMADKMTAQIAELDAYLSNMRTVITVNDTWRA